MTDRRSTEGEDASTPGSPLASIAPCSSNIRPEPTTRSRTVRDTMITPDLCTLFYNQSISFRLKKSTGQQCALTRPESSILLRMETSPATTPDAAVAPQNRC